MNKDEALKLALEALEYLMTNKTIHYTYRNKAEEAITAIKQARALDKMADNARELGLDYEPVGLVDRLINPEQHYEFTDPKKANAVLMSLCQEAADALAAPVQEPVAHPFEDKSVISALAWAAGLIQREYPAGHNGADSWLMNYADIQGERIRLTDHREWEKVHGRWKPITAPSAAQRQWVGLTDEEADKIYKDGSTFGEMMRMVEAKLKEKNI
jgi:hypothetical protein